ncbi:MAG: hypothetical protein WHT45_06030 [Ignavibacterium sp.]
MNYVTAIRQGDILFIQVQKMPDDCQLNNSLVLAEGEASGHKHQVISGSAKFYKSNKSVIEWSNHSQIIGYLEVNDSAIVGHDEHLPVLLTQGIFAVIQQRNFNPFEKGVSYVND